jgi:CRP-like cAMP-binding protein
VAPERKTVNIRLGALDFSLPDAVSEEIKATNKSFSVGATILPEGDVIAGIILVVDGWVATTKSLENGDVQLIDFILPGDFLDPATADGATSAVSVTAQTDCTICTIPVRTWDSLLKSDLSIRTEVVRGQAAERTRFSERILRLGKGNAKTRIAYALLELCVRLDALSARAGNSFHIPLTQGDIGNFTGLSTVHVCRMMGEFVKDGIIETDDHLDVHIIDLEALSDIAGIRPENLKLEIKSTIAGRT